MAKLGIIVSSARPNRVADHVAQWVSSAVDERFEIDVIDLKDIALPAFDEPQSPKSGADKTTDHGRSWGERIGSLDAAVILTPQYNGAYTGALKNAVDFLYNEWSGLPLLLVGYGWGEAGEVLPMLESLMTRVGSEVVDTIGLGFREDLSVEGELFVREEKTAQLRDGIVVLEQKALQPVG
ncbi:NADPH-dependent oxidoreductase [Brachybacterium endophyticum]|uniref:NADPH-dependent oxidoreductase n=1 Tax=Brachybacterium endophyticum TaxID=2182385 RepID=A0A2U2RI89_9MICO|nr:NAD(P)H-dependent oxidoreductase [Brachybacterium endophyticum]PWH05551.1 NADPH-dependent oxidoreductase [Brachybacterium endophyticum]